MLLSYNSMYACLSITEASTSFQMSAGGERYPQRTVVPSATPMAHPQLEGFPANVSLIPGDSNSRQSHSLVSHSVVKSTPNSDPQCDGRQTSKRSASAHSDSEGSCIKVITIRLVIIKI